LISVVFPLPERPTSAVIFPWGIVSEKWEKSGCVNHRCDGVGCDTDFLSSSLFSLSSSSSLLWYCLYPKVISSITISPKGIRTFWTQSVKIFFFSSMLCILSERTIFLRRLDICCINVEIGRRIRSIYIMIITIVPSVISAFKTLAPIIKYPSPLRERNHSSMRTKPTSLIKSALHASGGCSDRIVVILFISCDCWLCRRMVCRSMAILVLWALASSLMAERRSCMRLMRGRRRRWVMRTTNHKITKIALIHGIVRKKTTDRMVVLTPTERIAIRISTYIWTSASIHFSIFDWIIHVHNVVRYW